MKKLLLLTLLATAAMGAPKTPSPLIPQTKVAPPAASSALKPRGSKLLRSTAAPAGPKGQMVWLLFYGTKPKAGTMNSYQLSEEALSVTLKIAQRRKNGRKWIWKTLRTIPLGYCDSFTWQEAQLLWLKPGAKTGPIVRVPRSEADELIALPQGWAQKNAVRQVFGRMASSLAAISYQFDSVDEKGTLQVTEVRSERTEEGGENSYKPLTWNGKGWE